MQSATAAGSTQRRKGRPRRPSPWAGPRARPRRPRRPAGAGTVAADPGRPAGRLPQPAPVLGGALRRRALLRGQGGLLFQELPYRDVATGTRRAARLHPARPGRRHRRRLPARLRLRDAAGRRRRPAGRRPAWPGWWTPAAAASLWPTCWPWWRWGRCWCSLRHRPRGVRAAGRDHGRPRATSAGRAAALGYGTAAKIFPGVLAPLLVLGMVRRSAGGGPSSGRCRVPGRVRPHRGARARPVGQGDGRLGAVPRAAKCRSRASGPT